MDLQDFSGQGTALVGILDAFMDNKGIISDKEWRGFCSEAVLTASFDTFVYEENKNFCANICLTYFGNDTAENKDFSWRISDEQGNTIFCGQKKIHILNSENYIQICQINILLPSCIKTQKLMLNVKIRGPSRQKFI